MCCFISGCCNDASPKPLLIDERASVQEIDEENSSNNFAYVSCVNLFKF